MKYKSIITRFCGMAICLVLGTTSCQNWLDVSPESEVKYDDLFSTKNGFKDQLTGVYTKLCDEGLYGAHLTYGMVDALGQQYVWTQEMGNYYHFWRFEYKNSTCESIMANIWAQMYNAIANTNILLKGLDEYGSVLSTNEENIYRGEAYALRAFLHFDLLRMYGKSYASGANEKSIPYVTSISKNVTPLYTVSDVLDKIIADLKEASKLLENDPIKTGSTTTDFIGTRKWHLNYYAVRALMARVYMYKNDKENALACAKEVIDSEKFPWITNDKVTTTSRDTRDGLFKSECIFMLNNRSLKTLTEKYMKEGTSYGSGNILHVSPEVKDDIFEAATYGGYDWRDNYYFEQLDGNYYGSTKLWQGSNIEYNNQQPLVRVSEMWLIAAECATSKTDAVNYLNTLRQHRGFDASLDLKEENLTDEQLQTAIGKEYRKEFIGEGQWFFYCKRKDLAELPNTTVPFSKAYYVFPLSDQEKEYGNR